MKSNVKITSIFAMFCILLYFSSVDEVSGDHAVGESVIHVNHFEIIMKSSPPGLDLKGSGIYEDGTWVKTETVLLEWGAYEFVGWTVDGQWVDGNPYTVLADKDHIVTAMYSFHPVKKQTSTTTTLDKYELTIISPFGKTLGDGTYVDGTTVEFNVSEQFVDDEIYDGIRYAFSGWTGGNTPSLMSNVIKMNQTETISAKWDKQYRLDIVDSTDKTSIIKSTWHDEDSVAPLITSNVAPNFDDKIKRTINSWVSTGVNYAEIKEPTKSITSLVMDEHYKVSIDWKNQFYIDVSSPYGTVDGGGWYDEGDVVVASINQQTYDLGIAGTRLIFNGWIGDETSSGMNIQVPLNGPKTLEGTWKKQYLLTVNSDYGSPTGSGWYTEGDLASFGTNKPRDPTGIWNQQIFQGWIGDSESTSYTGTVLMNGPKIVNAVWEVDYSIAMFNGMIIAIAAIVGMILFVKSKKGFGKNKSSKTINAEIVPSKPKKSAFSSLGEIFNSKTTKTDELQNNEQLSEIVHQNEPEKIIPPVIASETPHQRSGQLENDIKNMDEKRTQSTTSNDLKNNVKNIELQNNDLFDKTKQFEYGLMEIEFEKKKIAYENENKETVFELERKGGLAKLERIENEIKFTEKNLDQKSTHLEKRLTEVQLQKRILSQKTERLEENIAENELEKKKSMMKLENDRTEIELQKNNLTQKTKELEKKLSEVKFEKDTTFQEKEQLKKNLSDVELQKKTALVELERKIHSIEFKRKEFDVELQKKSNEIELQKNHLSSNSALLEKSLAEVQLQKLTLSQKTEQLEENIEEHEFKKKNLFTDFENKVNVFEQEKKLALKKTTELENKITESEFERKLANVDLNKTISSIGLAKKRIDEEKQQLEKTISEVQLQKNNISKGKQQLEKTISEVQLQKNNLSQKAAQLEKSLAEVDLEKKKITFELERNLAESKFDKMKTTVTLEDRLSEIELQKNNLSQKTEQLEKNLAEIELEKKIQSQKTKYLENQILENTFEKKKIISDLKNKEAQIELEKKSNLVKLERKESEVQLQKNNLSQKTEQLEKSFTEVQSHKQILNEKTLDLETKLSKVNLEKKKLSSELQRKESIIELEEKRINQKAWDLEKRIAKFTLERNIAAIELEKKKITSELQQKESLIEVEKEHLFQRKTELQKTIAAFEIEQEIQSKQMDIDKNLKLDPSIKSQKLDGIISEIELTRKISDTELKRKEFVIELEKKDLEEKNEMLEKRIVGVETERKISFIQIERIESEIKLEKKNLENQTKEFGKKNTKNLNLRNNIDVSENSTSFDEFLEWSSELNDELSSDESPTESKKITSGE